MVLAQVTKLQLHTFASRLSRIVLVGDKNKYM